MDEKQETHFLALYALMLTDLNIDYREIETLYQIGIKRGVPAEEINKIAQSPKNLSSMPDTLEGKVALLYDLATMAWADGEIQQEEKILMRAFCVRLGFMEENADGITDFILEQVEKGISEQELLSMIK